MLFLGIKQPPVWRSLQFLFLTKPLKFPTQLMRPPVRGSRRGGGRSRRTHTVCFCWRARPAAFRPAPGLCDKVAGGFTPHSVRFRRPDSQSGPWSPWTHTSPRWPSNVILLYHWVLGVGTVLACNYRRSLKPYVLTHMEDKRSSPWNWWEWPANPAVPLVGPEPGRLFQ